MTTTTQPSTTPPRESIDSGAHEPDVALIGEWHESGGEATVDGSKHVAGGLSSAGRDRRTWAQDLSRNLRSLRPSAILALLVVTAAVFMLLDLRDGPTQILRSLGQSTGGAAQEWADRVIGPIQDTPLRRSDSEALQGNIAELEVRNQSLEQNNAALESQLRDLTAAGTVASWAEKSQLNVIPARVVAVASGRVPNRSVTIDVGRSDGLEPDMAVVGQRALVGRLVEVSSSTSTVQLISDRGSRVWSRIAESQETAVATGSGVGIELEFVDRMARVTKGQKLVTLGSPDSMPYPAGIPIASVASVTRSPGQVGLRVTAEPIADLSALNVVGVVSPRPVGESG